MTDAVQRFSLRDLPFPAKLVVTCFLLAVGGGYTAAMVQLHMQDSKSGEPMPTVADVILKYTGKKWFETAPPRAAEPLREAHHAPAGRRLTARGRCSRRSPPATAASSRRPAAAAAAITKRSCSRSGTASATCSCSGPSPPPDERKKAYEQRPLRHRGREGAEGDHARFKNADGGDQGEVDHRGPLRPLPHAGRGRPEGRRSSRFKPTSRSTKYLDVARERHRSAPAATGCKVANPISLDKLTQSTHAHLLSFAVLFSLHRARVRVHVVPARLCAASSGRWVLVAVVADVSLWWLARLCDQWGPVLRDGHHRHRRRGGSGAGVQIALSLFNMYGAKGKVVLLALFAPRRPRRLATLREQGQAGA